METLLELEGPRSKVGVATLLSEAGKEVRFRTLLQEFPLMDPEPRERTPREEDEDRIDELAREFCSRSLRVAVSLEGEGYSLSLQTEATLQGKEAGDVLEARPVTRSSWTTTHPGDDPLGVIQVPRVSEITSLIAFRIHSGRELAAPREFVLRGRLVGAPGDRLDQLFVDLVPDKRRFALLLFLILAAGDPDATTAAQARELLNGATSEAATHGEIGIPLYEALVRASARDIGRLRAVAQVVSRLTATEEGASRLPDGFAEMWESFKPLLERAGA